MARYQYAKARLEAHQQGNLLINIDESAISDLDGRMERWMMPRDRYVTVAKRLQQRVCMICAIDTEGRLFYSLGYVNTNRSVFCRFLFDLAEMYRACGRPWNDSVVLLLDGASYHNVKEVKVYVKTLRARLIISAPHSMEAAPAEQVFNVVKQRQLVLPDGDVDPR